MKLRRKIMKRNGLFFGFLTSCLIIPVTSLSGCSKNILTNWKSDGAITTIKNFVNEVCDKNNKNYVPEAYRVAAFDIDGTGIVERNKNNKDCLPQDQLYEYVYLNHRSAVIPAQESYNHFIEARAAYYIEEKQETLVNYRNAEIAFYNEVARDLTPKQLTAWLDEAMLNAKFSEDRKMTEIVYKPMVELVSYLKENNFQVYFVSGSTTPALYSIASKLFSSVDFEHCIGTDYKFNYSSETHETYFTDIDSTSLNLGDNKPKAIARVIGKTPVIAFGNSSSDVPMVQYAIENSTYHSLGVIINHDDMAREYQYDVAKMHQTCIDIGALEVSMANDFLTIF